MGVPTHLGHEPTVATSAEQPASETVVHLPDGVPPDAAGHGGISPSGSTPGTLRDQPPQDLQESAQGRAVVSGLTATGVPAVALRAYHSAADAMSRNAPSCGIDWALLAAIGKVESDHGRHAGSGLGADGVDRPPVFGPLLTRITDTDAGQLDASTTYDRAVGPMQFIAGTWRAWATDGNGDGVADPQNIYDAALTAARYLCAGGADVAANPAAAVFRYNHSASYVALVLALAAAYRTGGAVGIPGSGSSGGPGGGSGGGRAAGPRASAAPSAPGAPAQSPTRTPSASPTKSGSPSPSPTHSSASPSPTKRQSPSPDPTPTPTKSSPTPTPTKSSPSPTPTRSSPTPTPTPTKSSPTPTPTETTTPTPTPCVSASGTDGPSPSPSPSPTNCP
ncbi:MAG TPA: lytic transglycosylase domain-containing protein [Streptosporangiales bacterium]